MSICLYCYAPIGSGEWGYDGHQIDLDDHVCSPCEDDDKPIRKKKARRTVAEKPLPPLPPTEADGKMMAAGAVVLHDFMAENFDNFEWCENEAEVLASVIWRAMAVTNGDQP